MEHTPELVTRSIALLTVFLILVTALKYAIKDAFTRIRAIMSLFVIFIIITMTLTFYQYVLTSVYFIGGSLIFGMVVGQVVAVGAAKMKLMEQGPGYYMEHFAHIHGKDLKKLTWWSFFNFYTVVAALFCINLIGLSTVFFKTPTWAVITMSAGSILIGTLIPYLIHLWMVPSSKK